MKRINKFGAIGRAVGVVGITTGLVTGVTFAALQNTATLTNNSITSTVDGLLLDSDNGASFSDTDEGFAFANIEPGSTSDPEAFKLKNETDHVMDVNVQVTGEGPLPAGVDPTDITFIFDVPNGPNVEATWAQIINGTTDGVRLIDDLGIGQTADVTVSVKIDPSVSSDVNIGSFTFTFGESNLSTTVPDETDEEENDDENNEIGN